MIKNYASAWVSVPRGCKISRQRSLAIGGLHIFGRHGAAGRNRKNATTRDFAPGFPRNRPFNSFFNSPPYPPFEGPPPTTLLDVLNLPATPPIYDVARLIVAALLNAAVGYTPVLTTVTVKHMWEEYYTSGFQYFSPSSGARWNHDELVDYLLTTMS